VSISPSTPIPIHWPTLDIVALDWHIHRRVNSDADLLSVYIKDRYRNVLADTNDIAGLACDD